MIAYTLLQDPQNNVGPTEQLSKSSQRNSVALYSKNVAANVSRHYYISRDTLTNREWHLRPKRQSCTHVNQEVRTTYPAREECCLTQCDHVNNKTNRPRCVPHSHRWQQRNPLSAYCSRLYLVVKNSSCSATKDYCRATKE